MAYLAWTLLNISQIRKRQFKTAHDHKTNMKL